MPSSPTSPPATTQFEPLRKQSQKLPEPSQGCEPKPTQRLHQSTSLRFWRARGACRGALLEHPPKGTGLLRPSLPRSHCSLPRPCLQPRGTGSGALADRPSPRGTVEKQGTGGMGSGKRAPWDGEREERSSGSGDRPALGSLHPPQGCGAGRCQPSRPRLPAARTSAAACPSACPADRQHPAKSSHRDRNQPAPPARRQIPQHSTVN